MRRWWSFAFLSCLFSSALFSSSCGSSNSLTGSLSQNYSLDFNTVTESMVGSFFVIEYNSSAGIVAKLSVDMTGLTVIPGDEIDLTAQVGSSNVIRGTLEQIVGGDTPFPIQTGFIVFNQIPTVNQTCSGLFRITTSQPSGFTLNGNFSAKVTEAATTASR